MEYSYDKIKSSSIDDNRHKLEDDEPKEKRKWYDGLNPEGTGENLSTLGKWIWFFIVPVASVFLWPYFFAIAAAFVILFILFYPLIIGIWFVFGGGISSFCSFLFSLFKR